MKPFNNSQYDYPLLIILISQLLLTFLKKHPNPPPCDFHSARKRRKNEGESPQIHEIETTPGDNEEVTTQNTDDTAKEEEEKTRTEDDKLEQSSVKTTKRMRVVNEFDILEEFQTETKNFCDKITDQTSDSTTHSSVYIIQMIVTNYIQKCKSSSSS